MQEKGFKSYSYKVKFFNTTEEFLDCYFLPKG